MDREAFRKQGLAEDQRLRAEVDAALEAWEALDRGGGWWRRWLSGLMCWPRKFR